jgi:hypothetical protein
MVQELIIGFPNATMAQQALLANDLYEALELMPELDKVKLVRTREDAQDTGTLISIFLAAPAVVVLAKGLAAWLTRQNQARVTIKLSTGKIVLENMQSSDVTKAIKALDSVISDNYMIK